MEEKKLDINSIIGFILIFGILIFWFYQNQPTQEEIEAQKAEQERIEAAATAEEEPETAPVLKEDTLDLQDSTALANYQNTIGSFAYTQAEEGSTLLENNVVVLEIDNKGGHVKEVRMKNFVTYDSIPVYLVKDGNSSFGIEFTTNDNRVLRSEDLFFEPELSSNGENQVLSMKAKISPNQFLEYRYEMKPDDYLVDFTLRTQGMNAVLNQSQPISLNWKQKSIRHDKSVQYENRYTRLTYQHNDGKVSKLSESSDDEETEDGVTWLSYRQHFFSSILATRTAFETADLTSKNLVE